MNKPSENKSSLRFFGIGKMLPFLKKYRGMMATMALCGIAGSVIDIGTPVLSMHAPWEIISKADLYEAVKAYHAFLLNA